MAKKKETVFSERVGRDLAALGEDVWAQKIQMVAVRGIPDWIICGYGDFIAVELKKDGQTRPDPLQIEILKKIGVAHGHVFVAFPENWDFVYARIVEILAQTRFRNATSKRGYLL